MYSYDPIRVRHIVSASSWAEELVAALHALDIDAFLDEEQIKDETYIDMFDFRSLDRPTFVVRVLADRVCMTWITTAQRVREQGGLESLIFPNRLLGFGGFWSFHEYGPNEPGTSSAEAAQVISHALLRVRADIRTLGTETPPAMKAYVAWKSAQSLSRWTSHQYDEALVASDRAVGLEPENVVFWVTNGDILRKMKRFDEALSVLDRALALNSRFSRAYFHQGLTFADLGRFNEAREAFGQGIALNPAVIDYWEKHGHICWRLGLLEEALKDFDRVITGHNIVMGDTWQYKAQLLQALGREEEALAAYHFANNRDWCVWHGRGITLRALSRYEEALAAFNRSLSLVQTNRAVWDDEIALLEQLGHHAQAEEARRQRDLSTPESQEHP